MAESMGEEPSLSGAMVGLGDYRTFHQLAA